MGKGAETRERIVKRAMALASRDGFEGVSIGDLAEEMKLSKSGLFAHFGSKEDLQLAVLERATREFTAQVIQPVLGLERGEVRLEAFFERWLAWSQDSRLPGGCVLIAASSEFDDQPGPQRDFIEKNQAALVDSITRFVRGAVDAKQFRANLDCRQFAHELYALVIGFHQLKRLLRKQGEQDRVRASFERLLEWARR